MDFRVTRAAERGELRRREERGNDALLLDPLVFLIVAPASRGRSLGILDAAGRLEIEPKASVVLPLTSSAGRPTSPSLAGVPSHQFLLPPGFMRNSSTSPSYKISKVFLTAGFGARLTRSSAFLPTLKRLSAPIPSIALSDPPFLGFDDKGFLSLRERAGFPVRAGATGRELLISDWAR